MVKRIAIIGLSLAAASVLIGSLILWTVLSSWIPTQGKARLIQELERQWPVEVSIGQMRYAPFRGLVLKEVRVLDRATHERWLSTSIARVQVGWFRAFLQRSVPFRASAVIEAPCQTTLILAGRYDLRVKSLALDVQTTEVALPTIGAPLRRYIPAPLTDGTVRLTLRVAQQPGTPPLIAGRVTGTSVVWTGQPWRLSGDLVIDGTATPPSQERSRWTFDAVASLRHASLQGLTLIGAVTDLEGRARVTHEHAELEQVTGKALGSSWKLEGVVTMDPRPALEVLVTSHAELTPLAAAVPQLHDEWQPEGVANLRAVCRGPLQPSPFLDCLANAKLRDVTLSGSTLTHSLSRIKGTLTYDLLARRLTIHQVSGQLLDEPFTVDGGVVVEHPPRVALQVRGTVPLDLAMKWLPASSPVSGLDGTAAVNLQLNGPSTALRYDGDVTLHKATVRFATLPVIVERLSGSARLSHDRIDIPQAALTLNARPLTLTATIALLDPPRLVATVHFPQGQLQFDSRIGAQEVVIDQARVALTNSRVDIAGTVGRTTERPSALRFSGAVELSELKDLPFIALPQLDPWQLGGLVEVTGDLEGRLAHWPDATLTSWIRAESMSVRGVPLEQVVCRIEQRKRVLRIAIPSSLVADGKLFGELTLEDRENGHGYLLQADVVGLQLAKLAHAIPAWRSRSVTGTASAHTLASGTWEARSTWRGEGWFNASGEGLGDIPLLDRLFRGLFGVLGDRLGLEALRRAEITQASLQWQLSQARFSTGDLRLGGLAGTEPVAIYVKGSVGLDHTLDAVIEPELSEGTVLQSPTTSTLASTVLKAAGQLERLRRLIGRHRITGTLEHPEYRFEFSMQELLKQLAPAPADLLQNLLDVVR